MHTRFLGTECDSNPLTFQFEEVPDNLHVSLAFFLHGNVARFFESLPFNLGDPVEEQLDYKILCRPSKMVQPIRSPMILKQRVSYLRPVPLASR